jgi:hypothetical protein
MDSITNVQFRAYATLASIEDCRVTKRNRALWGGWRLRKFLWCATTAGQAGSHAVNPARMVRIEVGRDHLSDHGRVGTRVAVPWYMPLRKFAGCAPQRSLKGVINHAWVLAPSSLRV